MADSSDMDAAVLAVLTGDATLAGLMPDGVYMDVAPKGRTRFVIVSVVIHEDEYRFEGRAYERCLYLVKAVDQSTSGTTIKQAAARIDALLQDMPLTITGYTHMLTRREERIRATEVDETNPDLHWQHRGGRYAVLASGGV